MKRTETHTAALGGDAREAPRSPQQPSACAALRGGRDEADARPPGSVAHTVRCVTRGQSHDGTARAGHRWRPSPGFLSPCRTRSPRERGLAPPVRRRPLGTRVAQSPTGAVCPARCRRPVLAPLRSGAKPAANPLAGGRRAHRLTQQRRPPPKPTGSRLSAGDSRGGPLLVLPEVVQLVTATEVTAPCTPLDVFCGYRCLWF